jgi:hypothetical protein
LPLNYAALEVPVDHVTISNLFPLELNNTKVHTKCRVNTNKVRAAFSKDIHDVNTTLPIVSENHNDNELTFVQFNYDNG